MQKDDNKEHILTAGARQSSRNDGVSFPKLTPGVCM